MREETERGKEKERQKEGWREGGRWASGGGGLPNKETDEQRDGMDEREGYFGTFFFGGVHQGCHGWMCRERLWLCI